jgi:hypothetical protein
MASEQGIGVFWTENAQQTGAGVRVAVVIPLPLESRRAWCFLLLSLFLNSLQYFLKSTISRDHEPVLVGAKTMGILLSHRLLGGSAMGGECNADYLNRSVKLAMDHGDAASWSKATAMFQKYKIKSSVVPGSVTRRRCSLPFSPSLIPPHVAFSEAWLSSAARTPLCLSLGNALRRCTPPSRV